MVTESPKRLVSENLCSVIDTKPEEKPEEKPEVKPEVKRFKNFISTTLPTLDVIYKELIYRQQKN